MNSGKNEKKVLVLSFLGVITFIAVVVGATYVYFTAQGGGTGNININAQTATTDNLSFQIGTAISITANEEDFGSGAGNKTGSTYARAILTANNATNTATRHYYVYLNIESNDFEYTTVDQQGELLLKVTDPIGVEVTTISSLTQKTSGGVTGFDITTAQGLITIADNYEIVSTGTVTQDWNVEVIFANLDSDQNANTGKSFSASLIIQEEKIITNISDVCPDGGNLADCVELLNTTVGDNEYTGLYYHDADLANGANDNSYRYAGANPNNYVCFGSNETVCPDDNLYQMIGVFNGQVKLIKVKTIDNITWNSQNNNTWDENVKPEIYDTLNTDFLITIPQNWQNIITEVTWQVGGLSLSNAQSTSKIAYDNEVGVNQSGYEEVMKIGLPYVSDYGYSAIPEYWGQNLAAYNDSSILENLWLFYGRSLWTISRRSDSTTNALRIHYTGYIGQDPTSYQKGFSINPTFYLNSDVEFLQGDGSEQNPYILKID